MKIEIHTTVKKLSKSIINQMKTPTVLAMLEGETFGYMIKVKKDSYKSILVKYSDEYFVIDSSWRKGESSVYRRVGKWSRKRDFDTLEKCDEWWSAYQRIIKEAKTQIYI